MPTVTALYRYPVKGFTPEKCESLTVLPSGWVQGDRAFVFRFADAAPPNESGWRPKTNYAVLMNVPGLARATLKYDDASRRLCIAFPDGTVSDAALDDSGRAKLAEAVAHYLASQDISPLNGHPEKLPLSLVGGGEGQHFHDGAPGRVSLHSRASLRALTAAVDDPELDERRFRSNIVIEGANEWAELGWVGRRLRIGPPGRGATFQVVKATVRCLATHANPVTGERDCDVMNTLTRVFGHEKPLFGVTMLPEKGGEVHVGDEVTLL